MIRGGRSLVVALTQSRVARDGGIAGPEDSQNPPIKIMTPPGQRKFLKKMFAVVSYQDDSVRGEDERQPLGRPRDQGEPS